LRRDRPGDRSIITDPASGDEASIILNIVNTQGMEVELEHGTGFDDANGTNNHPF